MDIIEVLLLSGRSGAGLAVRQALEASPGIEIAGEAADAAQALQVVRCGAVGVVVADFETGLDLPDMLKKDGSRAACVLVAGDIGDVVLADALRRGLRGCVLLAEVPSELGPAVRDAALGEIHLSAALSKRMIKWFAREFAGC